MKNKKYYTDPNIKAGYVYFIGIKNLDGYVKIGYTKNIKARVNGLQISMPFDLFVIHKVRSNEVVLLEKKLHNYFEKFRIRGEWFKLNHDQVIREYNDFSKQNKTLYLDSNKFYSYNENQQKYDDISNEIDFIKNTFILPYSSEHIALNLEKGKNHEIIKIKESDIFKLHPNSHTGFCRKTIDALDQLGFKKIKRKWEVRKYEVVLKPDLKFDDNFKSRVYDYNMRLSTSTLNL